MVWPSWMAFVLFAASLPGPLALRSLKQPEDTHTEFSADAEGPSKAELREAQARYCSGFNESASFDACMGAAQRARAMCEGFLFQKFEEMQRSWHKSGHDAKIHSCTIQPYPGQLQQDSTHGKPVELCPIEKMRKGDSTMVYLPKPAMCLKRNNAPGFQVIRGDPQRIMISFGSGGVCTDVASMEAGLCCDKPMPVPQHGIFNHDHVENPYAGFTIIHIPPCSGDFGVGNVEHRSHLRGHSGETVQQRGMLNIRMTLDWVNMSLGSTAKEVVVVGHGDGGWTVSCWLAELFTKHYFPNWRAGRVLLDGGIAVLPPGTLPAMLGLLRAEDALFPDGLTEAYHSGTLTMEGVLAHHLTRRSNVLVMSVGSKAETRAMDVYNLVYHWHKRTVMGSHGWDPFMIKPEAYYARLQDVYFTLQDERWNFAHFEIDGTSSNHLMKADLWETNAHSPLGKPPKDSKESSAGSSCMLTDWLTQGSYTECVRIPNVCYGPRKDHRDYSVNEYDYCDPWFDSFKVHFNCPGDTVGPHKAPTLPPPATPATTADPMEFPAHLFTSTVAPHMPQ